MGNDDMLLLALLFLFGKGKNPFSDILKPPKIVPSPPILSNPPRPSWWPEGLDWPPPAPPGWPIGMQWPPPEWTP